MTRYLKIGIVVVLVGIVGLVIASKRQGQATPGGPVVSTQDAAAGTTATVPLPRLVDLGAHSCIPCKKMAPILDDLRREYAGRLKVEFIDVWQNPDAGQQYGIRLIPTQIFYNAAGKELARHEGFMSKEDILAQWSSLGVSLATSPARQE